MILILLIILILAGVFSAPVYPYSSGWGYYPSSIVGIIVVVLVIMYLTGHRF